MNSDTSNGKVNTILETNSTEDNSKILASKGKLVTACVLDNSIFTVVGVVGGTILGVRRRHFRPLVSFSLAGSFADLIFGYLVGCQAVIEDLKVSRAIFNEIEKSKNKSPDSNKDI